MNTQILFAVLFGILSFSLKNIGYVFQKKGVNDIISHYSSFNKKPRFIHFIKSRIWCFGILLPFLGGVFLAAGYAFGPVSMIMPFTGIGFVFLVLFVRCYLKEKIAFIEWVSIGFNIFGITFINLKGMAIRDSYIIIEEIFQQFITCKGLCFLLLPNIAIISLCIWSFRNKYRYGGTFYSILAGIIGGTGLIFQKPFSMGLKQIHVGGAFVHYSIIILSGFFVIGFSVVAVIMLNNAYKHGRGILVAPLYAIFQMIFPLLGGVLIFNEWQYLDRQGIIFQVIGLGLIIMGTGILAVYNEKKGNYSEKE